MLFPVLSVASERVRGVFVEGRLWGFAAPGEGRREALPGPAAAPGGGARGCSAPGGIRHSRLFLPPETHSCRFPDLVHSAAPKISVKVFRCFRALEEVCLGL